MVRAKICGITHPADRDAAVAAGADALGFLSGVPVETPRELSPGEAAALVDGVAPFVTSVLVTAPDGVHETLARQERVGADVVQVHGDLAPAAVGDLRDGLDAAVVAAIDSETANATAYAAAADALLVDSATEEGMGGTGETHDWERTRELAASVDVPVVLAGGLTPDNVGRAVSAVDPFAVDVASGVEREPGRKDSEAVRSFVERATGVAE